MLFMTRAVSLLVAVSGSLALSLSAMAAPYPAFFANGFENPGDVGGTGDDSMRNVARVASGTNLVPSASGAWHAEAPTDYFCNSGDCSFTRYGGYSSVFPIGGYTTTVDVYLNMAAVGPGIQADWSSAISQPNGTHRRDFIFSFGDDGAGGFAISASNTAPGWPANPARDPLSISASGWYTLKHTFYDSGSGVLAVDMSVLDAGGTVLKTWTLTDPSDVIGSTVGGNRYGWLVTNGFAFLALDNVTRSGAVAQGKDDCTKDGWMTVFRTDGSAFKNQGDCVQYTNTGK